MKGLLYHYRVIWLGSLPKLPLKLSIILIGSGPQPVYIIAGTGRGRICHYKHLAANGCCQDGSFQGIKITCLPWASFCLPDLCLSCMSHSLHSFFHLFVRPLLPHCSVCETVGPVAAVIGSLLFAKPACRSWGRLLLYCFTHPPETADAGFTRPRKSRGASHQDVGGGGEAGRQVVRITFHSQPLGTEEGVSQQRSR